MNKDVEIHRRLEGVNNRADTINHKAQIVLEAIIDLRKTIYEVESDATELIKDAIGSRYANQYHSIIIKEDLWKLINSDECKFDVKPYNHFCDTLTELLIEYIY